MKSKQHTVSKFYLSAFTPDSGQKVLWQYTKGEARARQISPRDATTEAHFYSIPRLDGTLDESFEDKLAEVERCCAPSLVKLSEGEAIDAEDRMLVAYFIGTMFMRIRGARDHAEIEKQNIESAEGMLSYLQRNRTEIVSRFSAEEIDAFVANVRKSGRGITMPKNFHLIGFFRRADRFARVIRDMEWTINRCGSPYFFVTSDNPAFARRPFHLRDPGVVGIGRADIGVELGFPLSKRSFLVAKWGRDRELRQIRASKSRVRELNTRTILSAHHHVFAPFQTPEMKRLVEENGDFTLVYPSMPVSEW